MSTVREIITAVRSYLGNPTFNLLNNGDVCLKLYDQIDSQINRLQLNTANWIIDRKEITVSPDLDEYALPSNFGRSFLVETVDDGTNYFRRRELDYVDVQDFNLFWSGVQYTNIGGEYTSHVAEVYGIFGDVNRIPQKTIKFAPGGLNTATYRLWYDVGKIANPALSDTPKLQEQFHNLLKVGTALACLPTVCVRPDGTYDSEKDAGFRSTLTMLMSQFDDPFERYIVAQHREDAGPRRAFNSSRRAGSGDYWW